MKKNSAKTNISRNQLHRLARISSLLLKNAYPTPARIVKEYFELQMEEGLGHGRYSEKTALRDIQILKNEFGCPLKYDRSVPGYYLTRRDWTFECPADLSESAMLTLIIGAKLVEDVFPAPLRDRVKSAVDEILKGNNPDFLDSACVKSLKIFAESSAVEISELFPKVFDAWLQHQSIKITYDDRGGQVTERVVDPHVLFLYNKEWRIKAYCHLKKAPRTFVVNRINSIQILPDTFEPDMKLIDSVNLDEIVSYHKIPNVKIRLIGDAKKFAIANKMHSQQTIIEEAKGESWIFHIPEIPKEVIVPWILSQGGNAIPLEPQIIVDEVRKKATSILQFLN